jgi:hypothetical protein
MRGFVSIPLPYLMVMGKCIGIDVVVDENIVAAWVRRAEETSSLTNNPSRHRQI